MWRRWLINTGLVIAGVAVAFAAFEGVLRTGLLNDLSIHWIPPEYKAITKRVMEPSEARSKRHPYIFNGPVAGFQKSDLYKARILVVGDSFVWGAGLPYNESWVRKFRRRINKAASGVEVVSWGHPGWSTDIQLGFMERVARQEGGFEADLVIIGFVLNDPDFGLADWQKHRKKIDWKGSVVGPLRRVLPYTFDFVTGHINALTGLLTDDYGHANWMDFLWSKENLKRYKALLGRLKAFLDEAGIPFVFAFTPAMPNAAYYQPKYATLAAMLDDLGISYVDLFPKVQAAFSKGDYGRNYRRLWATPDDPHPGAAVSEVLAEGVLEYLKRNGTLGRLAAKKPPALRTRLRALPPCVAGTKVPLQVAWFNRYPLAEGEPYLRVQGIAYEIAGSEIKGIENVYLKIGDNYFPAVSKLAMKVKRKEGAITEFPGWFTVDVPVAGLERTGLSEVVAVTTDGCRASRVYAQPIKPKPSIPSPLNMLPTIQAEALFGFRR